ncbi:regulatory protein GemA [[Pseudomonas] hibiscicola]|uniref:gp16 family protein n=1 Tax=Stenotrophomonas hibiscicola TaxID=86189 RepID=UPI003207EBD4
MTAKKDPRRAQIAKIHLAATQLGLDDATYRDLLRRVTGKDSTARMSVGERDQVISELRRLGFTGAKKVNGSAAFPGRPETVDDTPMLQKIEALLADAGRPWSYALAVANRMFKVDRLEWLKGDQLHRLIAALQIDANRGKKA